MPTDRRVRYTKMVLKDALIKLLRDKPISRISIKSICEEADVNRATYYAHYTDQYDQLNQIELAFVENIEAFVETMANNDPVGIVTNIFDYVAENRELCCTLMSPNGDIAFEEKIMELLRSSVYSTWSQGDRQPFSEDDYTYTYILAGGVGIVKKWLLDDAGRSSSRDMAERMLRLSRLSGAQTGPK